MTLFLDSFSTHQLLPPWQSQGLQMWSFVIKVQTKNIQTHLETHFNRGAPDNAPYRYTPLGPADGMSFGMFCVVVHPDFSSLAPGFEGWNLTSHNELYWTFPVWRHTVTPNNLLIEPELVWIQPFAFDDNSYVMFSAREIWGTEMEMANIHVYDEPAPALFKADVAIEGLKTFDPRSKSQTIGCMRIEVKPATSDTGMLALLDQDPELAAFVDLLSGAGIFTAGEDGGVAQPHKGMEVNTLKQFRDVFDMNVAAYRALVASRTVHRNIRDMAFYAGRDAVIEFMQSDSMRETLVSMFGPCQSSETSVLTDIPWGFGVDSTGFTIAWDMPCVPVEVAMVISYTADARFDVTRILHTYGQQY